MSTKRLLIRPTLWRAWRKRLLTAQFRLSADDGFVSFRDRSGGIGENNRHSPMLSVKCSSIVSLQTVAFLRWLARVPSLISSARC